ncbi:MAG TPA: helix-turn-helix transcriptional regulator [Xanthobacteraceae bacterium]|jgi:transcriptional regulator with XRE-family HTH domain|nr:helix-turn-helix transcriptional regulator [Xanthobacteraceae bacterium]
MADDFKAVGRRLKAHRLGLGLTADTIAERLGISRAAVYRIESGSVVKVETLEKLAEVLDCSLASLLGAGVEYYSQAISYFERMRQVEEDCAQVVAHFPPMSYLLTSDEYPPYLRKTLIESLPSYTGNRKKAAAEIDAVIDILGERKKARKERGLSVINFVTLPEIERWLKLGVVGTFDLPPSEVALRRQAARFEVEHLIHLVESEPMGVQIGLIEATLPNLTFQLFRTSNGTVLGLSPYRLGGDLPNVSIGVAMMTADSEPVRMYEQLADDLWKHALKGRKAVALLRSVIARSGIAPARTRKAS